jgi:hypothetical protein
LSASQSEEIAGKDCLGPQAVTKCSWSGTTVWGKLKREHA